MERFIKLKRGNIKMKINKFDEYLDDDKIQELRVKMYKL